MAEVPEHLLERSRARRAALGLGGGDAPAAGAAPAAATPTPSKAVAAQPASAPAVAPAAAAPAPVVTEEYVAPPPPPRRRVPAWAFPVLVALPFWAILYAGTFGERKTTEQLTPFQQGQQLFNSAGCSGCHGANGEGGVGPNLHTVLQTFPNEADQLAWVKGGSNSVGVGQPYGAADRPGGQRVAKGGMPAFGGTLSDEQITAVVTYERQQFGGAAAG